MKLFELHLAPGEDERHILSEEILSETQAQIMTPAEARAVGMSGAEQFDEQVRLIAVRTSDAGWIEKALERAPSVVGYRIHDVNL